MLRSLIHFRRTNLAVVAGTAVAAAVLTGALLVGDSVRGSLADLARDGLGAIDHALVGEPFVPADLADRLAGHPDFETAFNIAAPAILLRGDARHSTSGARASDVQIQGADDRLLGMMNGGATTESLFGSGPRAFPPAAINQALARELGVAEGERILVSLGRWSDIPAASLLGRRDTEDVTETLRLEVTSIIPDEGPGRFTLLPHQSQPLVVWVPLEELQRELDQRGRVNAVLVDAREGHETSEDAEALGLLLQDVATLEDLGLQLHGDQFGFRIESDRFVLQQRHLDAVTDLATRLDVPVLPVSTYLANGLTIRSEGGETTEIPYSTIAAMDPSAAQSFGGLVDVQNEPVTQLAPGEILLDTWAAESLAAEVGDRVELTYYDVAPDESLREETAHVTLAGIVEKEGLAADPELTQEYPGIADADRMSDWDPPFPVDLSRVTASDEEYWETWRGTPKAFVQLDWGRERWGTVWGDLTQIRIGSFDVPRDRLETELRSTLPNELDNGFDFEAVRDRSLRAASGTTDFGQLFLGFSFFLIGAAALLVAQLFRLGVEQRSSEIGLRLAVGFRPRAVRRALLGEGVVLAGAGSALGLVGAVAYAHFMILGLRTLWRPAVGTTHLVLHLPPTSLAIGWVSSVAIVAWIVHRSVRRVGEVPVPQLLAGRAEIPDTRPGRTSRRIAWTTLPVAALILIASALSGNDLPAAAFFVAGPLLLVGLLALLALRLDHLPGRGLESPRPLALLQIAAGNAARNRGRSLLAATSIASAAFILVTVAAFEHDFRAEDPSEIPGTGGFDLIAEAEIALRRDLSTSEGRDELGISDATRTVLETTRVVSLLRRPGDDASCLNLYRPEHPRLLGVPAEDMAETQFEFAAVLDDAADPWSLLRAPQEDGAIPVIGDMNSTQWILKLGLGDVLEMPGDDGRPVRLRLVATLTTSVFQSELLLDAERFRAAFPERTGDAILMLDTPDAKTADALSASLESDLTAYGLDVVRTVDRLADFHAVQNTFLATFQLLGGLGLLLGTLGLAFVLLRSVLERRGELATLRALGYRHGTLVWIVVFENTLLLAGGLFAGATAALVTAGAQLLQNPAGIPWSGLGITLGAVFLAGLVSCTLAAAGSIRGDLTPALKAEF